MDKTRRDFIRKGALGAGAVWATPVVVSLDGPAAAGTPGPCDCEHPPNPPKSVRCSALSHCTNFICEAVVAPCDDVRVLCTNSVICGFRFTATCEQTHGNRTGGTILSASSTGGDCDTFGVHIGDNFEFEYSVVAPP